MRRPKFQLGHRQGRGVAHSFIRGTLTLALIGVSAVASSGSISYTYDPLGRLTKAVFNNGSSTTTVIYNYDASGNRTSVSTTSP
ncbi:RHS repeat protein [Burkholderia multivorans]|uniref:RHS repeat domain-containing protein n=1 Tax=Burkholderia multivorans TaxID=87883 RepID=UPI000F4E356A|nr:hypothetical protein EGY19_16975 [Burkholderia multivorans]MBJ9616063.1 RHS repeat protein [Burkholderia multivorans]MBU9121553.1 RHS repeat protein [Burkholderia multivorans]MBU9146150.1 RHS repeat protein [Burkholderia multivorans]MBU9203920.1 RHS repeat protein [Burkholderia multivorans]